MADKHIFMKLDNYNDVSDVVELIKNKIKESRAILQKIEQMKDQENSIIEKWSNELDDMEKKFSYITDSFSQAGE